MKKLLSILFLMAAVQFAFATGYTYDQEKGEIQLAWKYDDMCGVFTVSNTEIIHWVLNDADNNCTLSAYGWSLTPNATYYSYYPYSQSYIINKNPMTALPVSYGAQSQEQNDNAAHLAAYDFMTAQTISTANDCHFDYQHLGSIIRFECSLDGERTLKSLTLASDNEDFTTTATMNATNGTLTTLTKEPTMTLALNDITVAEGQPLVAYMMMPPTNLRDKDLTVTLTDDNGAATVADLKGADILPGRVYPITLAMPPFDDGKYEEKPNGDPPLMAKRSLFDRPTAVTMNNPTAFAPNFMTDEESQFEQKFYILGDVNDDGEVRVSDASMLVNRCLEGTASQIHRKVADVNNDGEINITDAKAIIDMFLNN
ncbi:MAG: fimbrillin family protein [Prevotella sp.]|nr:fimbrillin family protein [Candidatus Prevotella equi]